MWDKAYLTWAAHSKAASSATQKAFISALELAENSGGV